MELNVVDLGDTYFVKLGMQLRALNQTVIEMLPGPDGVRRNVNIRILSVMRVKIDLCKDIDL